MWVSLKFRLNLTFPIEGTLKMVCVTMPLRLLNTGELMFVGRFAVMYLTMLLMELPLVPVVTTVLATWVVVLLSTVGKLCLLVSVITRAVRTVPVLGEPLVM